MRRLFSAVLSRWTAGAAVVVACVTGLLLLPGVLPTGGDESGSRVLSRIQDSPARAADPPSRELVTRLRSELAASAVDNPDYPFDPAAAALVATSPQEYVPLGRVAVPDIGLDVVYAAGVHPSVLERGPGHWPGSATPGQPGTAVLSGHRTTHTAPFGDLDRLAPGDPIVVTPDGAVPVTYRVTGTEFVLEADYRAAVLAPPAQAGAAQLVLFACHPKGDRTHRVVVRAIAAD